MRITVMGSSGNQGRLILPKLRQAGFEIRAVRATPGKDEEVLANGASEVRVGDATDRKFLREVMEGADAVYHLGPTGHPQERDIGFAAVDVAREVGVGHFIFSSVLHAIATEMPQHKHKLEIEEHLLKSNMPFTILKPANFMLGGQFHMAFKTRMWAQFYNLDRSQSMIDLRDVADVVVKVASERDKHFGATYELCAPGNHSGRGIAREIAEITGLDVTCSEITLTEYFERFYGIGQSDEFRYQIALVRSIALWLDQYNFAGNPNVLSWLLGRDPLTLGDFIRHEWALFKEANATSG